MQAPARKAPDGMRSVPTASSKRNKTRNARRKQMKAQRGLEQTAQVEQEAMADGVIQQQQQGVVINLD